MIKDIISGPMGSDPEPIAAEDTLVLFYATTLVAGRELWCTNINEGQTAMVADVFAGVDGSVPMSPRVCADAEGAYIVALTDARRGCVLHRYDYVTNTMREVGDVADDAAAMARIGKKLLFKNVDAANGSELWLYDETNGDFGLLADLWPGSESSKPAQFFLWDDRILFQARTESHGTELWVSDGTEAGTTLVSDINPGPGDSDPYGFVLSGAHLFFRATDDACGRELWVTDGTREGTTRVTDVLPGSASSEPYNLVACEQSLLFTADDGVHGEELWGAGLVDGTWKAGLLCDLYPGLLGSEPYQLQWANDQLAYFLAKTPEAVESVYELRGPYGTFVDADSWRFQVISRAARHDAP
jgi:ELWxxDGT repeat protein